MISLATSLINQKVRDNINACLDEGRIGRGRFVDEFEEKTKELLGVKHAIAVCNGTMADIIALATFKILQPEKNEVIVPALTFIAQTNSVLINGLKPVFIDVGDDCQIDLNCIKAVITDKTLAIFPVHLLGRFADVVAINRLAKEHDLFVAEDTCEAWGGQLIDKPFGTFGDIGTFSFFPSHTITTGEGGMVVTDNDKMAEIVRKLVNHGRRSTEVLDMFHFDFVGFNGKMSNLNAAVGCGVIDSTNEVINKRQKNVQLYNELLGRSWSAESPHCYPVFYSNSVERDAKLVSLAENGVEARKLFSCVPIDEYKLGGDYPFAKRIGETALFVPVHQDLTEEDIKKVASFL